MGCRDCGMAVPEDEFHPHLFCAMFRGGIRDPRRYLELAGWVYTGEQSVVPRKVRDVRASDDTKGAS